MFMLKYLIKLRKINFNIYNANFRNKGFINGEYYYFASY